MFQLIDPRAAFAYYLTPFVEKGAAYLDEYHEGWASKIATDRLDISQGDVCICGQIFGDFSRRDAQLTDAWQFGFNLPTWDEISRADGSEMADRVFSLVDDFHSEGWKILDLAWLNEVWWRLPEPTFEKREAWIKARREEMLAWRNRNEEDEECCDDPDCSCGY